MGVQLTNLVPKKEITFDELKNKKIAIDASQMLYQFLSSIRQKDGTPLMDMEGRTTSHLVGLSSRIPNLMNKGLKLCFVFDGKPPKQKKEELELRYKRKTEAKARLEQAKEEGDEDSIKKYTQQSISVYKEMADESKEFIKALGLPVIQAPSEAEAQAAFMAEKKDMDYVASSDYDALLYGAPKMLRNLTLASRRKLPSGTYISITPEVISLSDTLNSLGITRDQLIVLSILVGTDFNPSGVKGIGPKTALRLVKEHKDFDEIFKEVKADFNWKKVYAIFKSMPIMKEYQLKWTSPDQDKIRKILVDNHDFNEERVDSIISKLLKTEKTKNQSDLKKWF